ncbi:hypothetical protein Bbelb_276290 [Branchiostoma belcheri]|nr:hypothetical protein Bbelb_276290 [Branchiostoma belcheri]
MALPLQPICKTSSPPHRRIRRVRRNVQLWIPGSVGDQLGYFKRCQGNGTNTGATPVGAYRLDPPTGRAPSPTGKYRTVPNSGGRHPSYRSSTTQELSTLEGGRITGTSKGGPAGQRPGGPAGTGARAGGPALAAGGRAKSRQASGQACGERAARLAGNGRLSGQYLSRRSTEEPTKDRLKLFKSSRDTVYDDTLDVGYADDVGLSRSVSLKKASTDSAMTEEASQLDNWADRNDMLLNGKKSQMLLICFSRNAPVLPPLSLGGELVPVTTVAKGLGFIFDNKLSWREHVKSMVSKASSRLHYLRLLTKQGMSVQDLVQVYLSLIRPVLEYGHVLLVGCSEEQAASMERVQRRALRIISRGGRRSVPTLPSLKERREAAAVSLFKAMLNPEHPLHDLVPAQRQSVTGRSLRNSHNITVPHARTKRLQQSFLHYTIRLYNNLP